LQPFAALIDGNLDQVGGGTHIAPTIKVQWVKDAKAALTPPTNAPNPESE
jgi:predicted alpha/beta-hydrolase family hydrolase